MLELRKHFVVEWIWMDSAVEEESVHVACRGHVVPVSPCRCDRERDGWCLTFLLFV